MIIHIQKVFRKHRESKIWRTQILKDLFEREREVMVEHFATKKKSKKNVREVAKKMFDSLSEINEI
jgi:hypothetical protein